MKIEIYVQSRGVAQEYGYCWVDDHQNIVEADPLVKKAKDLIESEAFSVVLARNSDKLLLLVTGLKASERKDYRGRPIRNSVAWIGQDTDKHTDEPTLRSIAARALLGFLEKYIDGAVTSGGEKGFEVSFEKIKTLAEAATNPVKSELLDSDKEKQKIGRTSDKLKQELASDLEKYRLPRQEPEHTSDNQQFVPLVVVTGIQDEETLKEAGVWRGLSSLVDSNSQSWKEIKYYQNPAQNGGNQGIAPRLAIVIIIISLSVNIWLLSQQVEGRDRIRNLENQVQNLQAQKLALENQVQPLKTQVHDLETQLQKQRTQRADLKTVVKNLQTQNGNLENQVKAPENQISR
jgi:cell division protein FtsL